MGILATSADERVRDVRFDADSLIVDLMDGRTISVPLSWYPRLHRATPAKRRKWKISGGGYGIHWPELDEDLSTEGLLRGAPAPRPRQASEVAEPSRPSGASSDAVRRSGFVSKGLDDPAPTQTEFELGERKAKLERTVPHEKQSGPKSRRPQGRAKR